MHPGIIISQLLLLTSPLLRSVQYLILLELANWNDAAQRWPSPEGTPFLHEVRVRSLFSAQVERPH